MVTIFISYYFSNKVVGFIFYVLVVIKEINFFENFFPFGKKLYKTNFEEKNFSLPKKCILKLISLLIISNNFFQNRETFLFFKKI